MPYPSYFPLLLLRPRTIALMTWISPFSCAENTKSRRCSLLKLSQKYQLFSKRSKIVMCRRMNCCEATLYVFERKLKKCSEKLRAQRPQRFTSRPGIWRAQGSSRSSAAQLTRWLRLHPADSTSGIVTKKASTCTIS